MRRLYLPILLALLAGGCHSSTALTQRTAPPPVEPTVAPDQVVATVDGHVIGIADVERQASSAHVTARVALEQLVTSQTLAEEAERRGLRNQPDVIDAAEREEARVLLGDSFEKDVTLADIPLAAVRRAYQRNIGSLDHGVQIDVWHILVPATSSSSPADREKARLAAEDLAKRARGVTSAEAFCALAATVVAPRPAKFEKVVTAEKGWTVPEFSQGAFRTLKKPGDTSPVIATEYGYHVMYLNGFHPAIHISPEDAEPHIREQLYPEFRRQRFLAFCDALAAKHQVVRINDLPDEAAAGDRPDNSNDSDRAEPPSTP